MTGELVTAPHHLQWRDRLWGWPLSPWTISNLRGWHDLPPVRSAQVDRPDRHGVHLGKLRAGARLIEVELTQAADDDGVDLLEDVRDATALDEDPAEEPLTIWSGTGEPQTVWARLERRSVPTDWQWSIGHRRVVMQWLASDPRRYSAGPELSASVGLSPPVDGGLEFPLLFPLDFGDSVGAQILRPFNAGNVAVWPLIDLAGPLMGVRLVSSLTGQVLAFDPAWEIPAGQTVSVDTGNRSVTLAGVSQRTRLHTAQWFPLAKKSETPIVVTTTGAYDPASQVTVRWRHGHM